MKHSLGLAVFALLVLCACQPPRVVYQRVEVPVATPCPEPPADALVMPDLPIYHLSNKPQVPSDPSDQAAATLHQLALRRWEGEVLKAYAESTAILLGRVRSDVALFRGYLTPRPK